MQQALRDLGRMFNQVIDWLFQLFQTVWSWSFGQVFQAFQQFSKFQSLPIWKQVLLVLVIAALAYLIYVVALDLWNAVRRILLAFVTLVQTLIDDLLYVLIAGAVAFGGSWAINNLTIPALP